jgi:hypothetical protein
MVTFTVLAYSVDSTGRIYGEAKPKHVWTKELMESYRGMRYVSMIFENENGKSKLIWENRRG